MRCEYDRSRSTSTSGTCGILVLFLIWDCRRSALELVDSLDPRVFFDGLHEHPSHPDIPKLSPSKLLTFVKKFVSLDSPTLDELKNFRGLRECIEDKLFSAVNTPGYRHRQVHPQIMFSSHKKCNEDDKSLIKAQIESKLDDHSADDPCNASDTRPPDADRHSDGADSSASQQMHLGNPDNRGDTRARDNDRTSDGADSIASQQMLLGNLHGGPDNNDERILSDGRRRARVFQKELSTTPAHTRERFKDRNNKDRNPWAECETQTSKDATLALPACGPHTIIAR